MPQETDVPGDLKSLLQRQALDLSDRHWRQDVELLAQALEKGPGIAKGVRPPGPWLGGSAGGHRPVPALGSSHSSSRRFRPCLQPPIPKSMRDVWSADATCP